MNSKGNTSHVLLRYQNGEYLHSNPMWDSQDSPWKGALVEKLLKSKGLTPQKICEVGCGAGEILLFLKDRFPQSVICGFDISVDAERFWTNHNGRDVKYFRKDFIESGSERYDCILLLDVIEHLENPFAFLEKIRQRGKYFIFHIPLDLSAWSILRKNVLLKQRDKVGHIHFFTKDLALALLREAGFNVIQWNYTDAFFTAPNLGLITKGFSWIRWFALVFGRNFAARLLGGQTLLVLATISSGNAEG